MSLVSLEIEHDLKVNKLTVEEYINSNDISGNIIKLETIKSNRPITTNDPSGNYIDISGSALWLPRGNTASRMSVGLDENAEPGMVMYDDEQNQFIGVIKADSNSTTWTTLGGVISIDRQNYINANGTSLNMYINESIYIEITKFSASNNPYPVKITNSLQVTDDISCTKITATSEINTNLLDADNINVDGEIKAGGTITCADISGNQFVLNTIKSNRSTSTDPCGNYIDISGSALLLPRGNTASRMSVGLDANAKPGMVMYDDEQNQFIGVIKADSNSTTWTTLGGVVSIDQETKITADNVNGLQFYTNGDKRMVIKSSDIFPYVNVGIGVVAPNEALEVNGTVKATTFHGNVTGNVTGSSGSVAMTSADSSSSTPRYILFSTAPAGPAKIPLLSFSLVWKDNRLGIGTQTPSEALEVNGWVGRTAHNVGGLCGGYNNIGSNAHKSNPIYVMGSSYKPSDSTLGSMYGIGYCYHEASFISGTADGWGLYVAQDGVARTFLSAGENGKSYIHEGGGSLGIGTASPESALHVVGDVKATNFYTGGFLQSTLGVDKIGFPSANTFSITTNNEERMNIDANGNIGIGKAPQYGKKIDVDGDVKATNFYTGGYLWSTLGSDKIGFSAAGNFKIHLADQDRILVDSNGRVGIGWNYTPSQMLDVNGNINATGNIACDVQLTVSKILSQAGEDMNLYSQNSKDILFWSGDDNLMRIRSDGNVCIGDAYNPGSSYKLDVDGNVRATGTITTSKNVGSTVNSDNFMVIETIVNSLASSNQGIKIQKDDGVKRGFKIGQSGSSDSNSYLSFSSFSGMTSIDDCLTISRNTGNVGIGIEATEKLHVDGDAIVTGTLSAGKNTDKTSYFGRAAIGYNSHVGSDQATFAHVDCNSYSSTRYALSQTPGGQTYLNGTDIHFRINNGTSSMYLNSSGYLGIGYADPRYPLHVGINRNSYEGDNTTGVQKIGYRNYTYVGIGSTTDGDSWTDSTHNWSDYAGRNVDSYTFSAYFYGSIAVMGNYIVLASDKRIKENITEVPDNLSLQKLRDISCCYYEYKDKISRGDSNVIGFIAQQVREHMPLAVKLVKKIIPNEMRVINPQWATLTDASGIKYKLTIPDLSDVSGNIKYKFYVTNDPSDNDVEKEIFSMENDPKSFIFEEKWQKVFVYGKEVDDFHALNKQALFTLNFSATQEIDRIQQQEKTKLTAAEAKIVTLEAENATLKARLDVIEAKLL